MAQEAHKMDMEFCADGKVISVSEIQGNTRLFYNAYEWKLKS